MRTREYARSARSHAEAVCVVAEAVLSTKAFLCEARALIDSGADLNLKTEDGKTALSMAEEK